MAIYFIVAVIAYLLGSIPFGYILMRVFRGEDVRAIGSGNIGATNVARKAPGLGVATLVLDAAKGYLAVSLSLWVLAYVWTVRIHPDVSLANLSHEHDVLRGDPTYAIQGLAAICVMFGHIFPIWLRFKGGKGVATGVGAFTALAPKAVLIVLAIFAAIVAAFRYISLGSIVAAGAFPIFAWLLYRQASSAVFAAMMAASALIILKHKENIRRLLAGTEHRFELKHR